MMQSIFCVCFIQCLPFRKETQYSAFHASDFAIYEKRMVDMWSCLLAGLEEHVGSRTGL